jgi:hypothetical protein
MGTTVFDAGGVQPQPEPPADFTLASRVQQASVPAGAGPPQQPLTPSDSIVRASRVTGVVEFGFMVASSASAAFIATQC